MASLPDTINNTADAFARKLTGLYGDSLQSVILYGPAARGEKNNEGYLHFLVVLDDNTPSELALCASEMKGWAKKKIATPLFLTRDYIARSLDTFPLEFMNMRSTYHVIEGEDVLEGLSFDHADIRSQCERELKGKLLHLRAEYLIIRGQSRELMNLVGRSLETFRMVFIGALTLKGEDVPVDTDMLLGAVAAAFELDDSLFKKLTGIIRNEIKLDVTEADKLFDLYVEELDSLAHAIDDLETDNG